MVTVRPALILIGLLGLGLLILAVLVSVRAGELADNLDRLKTLNERQLRSEEIRLMVARIAAETRVAISSDDPTESALSLRAGRSSAQSLLALARERRESFGAMALPADTVRRIEDYVQARLEVFNLAERGGSEAAQRYFQERRVGSARRDLETSLDITVEAIQLQLERERSIIEATNNRLVFLVHVVTPIAIVAFVALAFVILFWRHRLSPSPKT